MSNFWTSCSCSWYLALPSQQVLLKISKKRYKNLDQGGESTRIEFCCTQHEVYCGSSGGVLQLLVNNCWALIKHSSLCNWFPRARKHSAVSPHYMSSFWETAKLCKSGGGDLALGDSMILSAFFSAVFNFLKIICRSLAQILLSSSLTLRWRSHYAVLKSAGAEVRSTTTRPVRRRDKQRFLHSEARQVLCLR